MIIDFTKEEQEELTRIRQSYAPKVEELQAYIDAHRKEQDMKDLQETQSILR